MQPYVARDVTGRLHAGRVEDRTGKSAAARLKPNRPTPVDRGQQKRTAAPGQSGWHDQHANRRYFDGYTWHMNGAARYGRTEPLALILPMSIISPKYNDHYGHQAGDDALRQVAQAMAQQLRRPADLLARYGGEEFVVLLPGTSLSGAVFIAESMRVAVEQAGIPHMRHPTPRPASRCRSAWRRSYRPKPWPKAFFIYGADQALYIAKNPASATRCTAARCNRRRAHHAGG